MGLKHLLKIGQLETHETNALQIQRLLASATRCIDDARQVSISPETRLEAAYRAITQLSMLALWANGYRPGSKAGHHMTMIQSLVHSVGLDRNDMLVLDTFRVKRNAANYSGEDVDTASVEECTEAADNLFDTTITWLRMNRPDLLLYKS